MCSKPTASQQQGAALLLAVVALAAIGAMVAGCFLAGWLEQRSAAAGRYGAAAFEAAEAGAAQTIGSWSPALSRLPLHADSVALTGRSGLTDYTATVTRLAAETFLVRSKGRRLAAGGTALAERLVGVFVRLDGAEVDHGSALTLAGPATVANADVVDGSDHVPPGWGSVCSAPADVPAIRSGGSSVATDSGPPAPVVVDTVIGSGTFRSFGAVTFDQLAGQASHELGGTIGPLAPSAAGGRCNQASGTNWGEPVTGPGSIAECFGFLPVVYAPGDLALAGGRGQGVLLVRGNLELSGGVEFTGVIVVLGRVTTSGAGGRVTGTMLVGGTGMSTLGSGSSISFSSCAVRRALQATGVPRRLSQRAWSQLY